MKDYKTYAHIHSLNGEIDEITVLEKCGNNDYIVQYKDIKCHAIFNYFTNKFYVDDKFRRVD